MEITSILRIIEGSVASLNKLTWVCREALKAQEFIKAIDKKHFQKQQEEATLIR